MKLIQDYKDIERTGETLVQCFTAAGRLTESAAKLLHAKASLITESVSTTRFPLMESFLGRDISIDYVLNNEHRSVSLHELITAYVDVSGWPTAVDLAYALGIPKHHWEGKKSNPEARAKNKVVEIIRKAREYDEGKKWLFANWKDRDLYNINKSDSIHPAKLGTYELGASAKNSDARLDRLADEEYNQRDMIDGGSRGSNTPTDRFVRQLNKSAISSGEFYSNISRIKPSIWGRVWQREKSQVRSDRGFIGRRWKKVFVLGYQIDKNTLYEIWYGTMDGMFTVHDTNGNQVSRKFPTNSEAIRTMTNAIVQSSDTDAQVFSHGGRNPNQIAMSISKSLGNSVDTMVNDLMKIEDAELEKREQAEARREQKRRKDQAEWENTKRKLQQNAKRAATSPIQTTKDVYGAGKDWVDNTGKEMFDRKIVGTANDIKNAGSATMGVMSAIASSNLVQRGIISDSTVRTLTAIIKGATKLTIKHAEDIGRSFNIREGDIEDWKSDIAAGKMTMEEFAIKVETARGNVMAGLKGMNMAQATRAMKNSNTVPYYKAVRGNMHKTRQYATELFKDRVYEDSNRTMDNEIELITIDTFDDLGKKKAVEYWLNAEKLIDARSGTTRSLRPSRTVQENFNDEFDDRELFDISDELDDRRDGTVNTLRRNSAKVAMTIADLKEAINMDLVELYTATRIDESRWNGTISRLLNRGRRIPIALPTDKPSRLQRVKMFFQGTRYRADFVTGLSLSGKINIEVWYVTEPNPNAGIFDTNGFKDAEFHGRPTISSFYVFDITSATLIRQYLPYHKNALQVAMAKIGAII